MKESNLRKKCIMLAMLQTLLLTAGIRITNNTNVKEPSAINGYDVIDYESYLDENGMKCETFEVAPIVTHYNEPITSMKKYIVDGKVVEEEATTYSTRIVYTAPSCATRVEGTGANMRCFVDYGFRPVTSMKTTKDKTEYVTTYSYGVIYPKQEESKELVLK